MVALFTFTMNYLFAYLRKEQVVYNTALAASPVNIKHALGFVVYSHFMTAGTLL